MQKYAISVTKCLIRKYNQMSRCNAFVWL